MDAAPRRSCTPTEAHPMKQQHLRSRSSPPATLIRHAALEALEPRQLLTTITGGDTFTYQDPSGAIVRITLGGGANTAVELIGATSDPSSNTSTNQAPALSQLPGRRVTESGQIIDVLGGVGGADGVEP